ncbi:MAG: hypothetical protein R3275_00695 [Saprospiraceae bacterium]|nr:hypothetical protein [Saprospiraceae bacterium]
MKISLSAYNIGIFLILLAFLSCESEKQYEDSDIVGRWEVYKCERGGKPTQTLNGAYFEFTDQNQLFTNFTGEGIMSGYNIYNNVIVQQTGEKIRYKIESMSDDKMTLSTNIRNVDFVVDLVKTSSL